MGWLVTRMIGRCDRWLVGWFDGLLVDLIDGLLEDGMVGPVVGLIDGW